MRGRLIVSWSQVQLRRLRRTSNERVERCYSSKRPQSCRYVELYYAGAGSLFRRGRNALGGIRRALIERDLQAS